MVFMHDAIPAAAAVATASQSLLPAVPPPVRLPAFHQPAEEDRSRSSTSIGSNAGMQAAEYRNSESRDVTVDPSSMMHEDLNHHHHREDSMQLLLSDDEEGGGGGNGNGSSKKLHKGETQEERDKKRRAFKACAHCRQRKAKCDLGDLNNPHDPPCARCKREGISCTFLPSRRGGRVPFAARKSKEQGTVSPDREGPSNFNPSIPTNGSQLASPGGTQKSNNSQTKNHLQTKSVSQVIPSIDQANNSTSSSTVANSSSSATTSKPVFPKRESSIPLPTFGNHPFSQASTSNATSDNSSNNIVSNNNASIPRANELSIDPGLTSFDPTRPGGLSTLHHSAISAPTGQGGFGPIDFSTIMSSNNMSNPQHHPQQQQQQQRSQSSQHDQQQRPQSQQRHSSQSQQMQHQHQQHAPHALQQHPQQQGRQHQQQNSNLANPYQQSSRDGDQTYFTVPYQMSSISPPSTNWQQHQQHQQQRAQDRRGRSDLDATLFNPGPSILQQTQGQMNTQPQQQQSALNRHGSISVQVTNTSAPGAPNQSQIQQPTVNATVGQASTTPGSQTSGGLSAAGTVPAAGNTIVSPSGESHSSYDSTHRSKSKRHHTGDEARIADPEILAAAKLRNPVDALDLLIQAADTRVKGEGKGTMTSPEGVDGHHHHHHHHEGGDASMRGDGDGTLDKNYIDTESRSVSPPPFTLADFPLVKRGIVTTIELIYFVNLFFNKIHHIFPIVPHHRIPTTEASLTAFARDELHLTTVFVLIASRLDQGGKRGFEIHDKSWEYMRELINDLVFGKDATVGAVEALLLLSENPPRQLAGSGSSKDDYAEENRMSWMIVGNAVRLGYMLALDQTTIYPVLPKAPDTPEGKAAIEKLDRERIAWTYCYIFDRQISIRTGKAFWSRGPGLCFTGSSADSFPSMRPIAGVQDDWASVIQAYVEITQTMTSAHDILYPSRDRTIALVRVGEYYKYIDEFTRTLNAFRYTWEGKKWDTFPLTECVWITFHYLRLYIYAFAFQAHVQRATDASEETDIAVPSSTMFPRGPMGSPDAKFILEAIDAAADLLRICTDRLHPQGVLQFLPWRYFLYFAYAGVFLLKAVFIKAVAPLDRRTIVRLLKRLIVCLACSSKDEHHHAVRYARLLNSLLKTFSRGRDGVGTGAPTPLRKSPSPAPQTTNGEEWPLSRATSPQTQAAPTPNLRTQFFTTNTPSSNLMFPNNNNPTSVYDNTAFLGGQGPSLAASQLLSDSFPANTAQEEATAADLLSDFNLDFGFQSGEQTAPFDAYSNLLDDTTMNFWAALSNSQGDWPNYAGNMQP